MIDPTINPGKMEMYADKQSRGGASCLVCELFEIVSFDKTDG